MDLNCFVYKNLKMKINSLSKYVLLPFLSFFLLSCHAQIQSGIIDYDVNLVPNEDGEVMKEAFSDGATIYFNKDYIKLVKKGNLESGEFTITDLKKQEESTYVEVMDHRFAVLFDIKYISPIGEFKMLDEYKTIAGFSCQKAVAPMGDGQMVVYLSKDIKVDYCPYTELDGFALEYSLVMPYGQLTYTARSLQTKEISSNDILPKESYEAISINDFNKKMTDLMGGGDIDEQQIDFSKISMDGKLISLETLKDNVVVLNFWFTSCAPCKAEIPQLNELKKEFQRQDVRFVAISFDPESVVKDFMQTRPFDFEMITDARKITDDFKVRAYPSTLILDKNGNIVHRIIGGSPNIKKELKPLIEEVLNN